MNHLVVDSHALIWYFEGHAKLSHAARDAMNDPTSFWIVPAICVCEVALTLQKGKYRTTFADVCNEIDTLGHIAVAPIDYEIAIASVSLRQLDGIHDQLIVAMAMTLRRRYPTLRLVTSDATILASNLVPTIW